MEAWPKARPALDGRSWLRVVVEKPFGKDLCSSEALAEDIAKYYPEEQVRRRAHVHTLSCRGPLTSPGAGSPACGDNSSCCRG